MPVYMASNKNLYYQFATRGIPRTYVIDEEGVVQAVYTDSPIADYNTLDGVLQGMLKGDGSEDIVDLSVRLNVAAPNLSEEDYFQNEYTVSHLELFFFDAETKKFVTKAVINDLHNMKMHMTSNMISRISSVRWAFESGYIMSLR